MDPGSMSKELAVGFAQPVQRCEDLAVVLALHNDVAGSTGPIGPSDPTRPRSLSAAIAPVSIRKHPTGHSVRPRQCLRPLLNLALAAGCHEEDVGNGICGIGSIDPAEEEPQHGVVVLLVQASKTGCRQASLSTFAPPRGPD